MEKTSSKFTQLGQSSFPWIDPLLKAFLSTDLLVLPQHCHPLPGGSHKGHFTIFQGHWANPSSSIPYPKDRSSSQHPPTRSYTLYNSCQRSKGLRLPVSATPRGRGMDNVPNIVQSWRKAMQVPLRVLEEWFTILWYFCIYELLHWLWYQYQQHRKKKNGDQDSH